MKPGRKMMLAERARQGNRNENPSNRRMIGFDRDAERERSRAPGIMPYIPPMEAYGYGNEMNYGRARYNEQERPGMGGYANYPERDWPYEGNRGGREYARRNAYNESPESRRRRDKRGRFMMGDSEYDEDDEDDDYRPKGMIPGMPRPRGNSYGDIYAEGTIWAPNAMNRPASSMMPMPNDMSAPVDEYTARMWVGKMDGGEHFKIEQAEQHRNAICPECDKWEYFVAINAMYSDYCETAKKFNIDKPEYYGHLARDFLKDKDAGPHKLRKYMETIPKK